MPTSQIPSSLTQAPRQNPPADNVNRRFSVAPMMDWTDRHCRYFHRLLSQHALLYTEMVTTGALIHGNRERFLRYDQAEHPLALQLGGSNPQELAECAQMAQDWGYDEVNLNVGCPSDRVQNNMIGACLMAHPQLVAECLSEMQARVSIPVTIKHRLGIDDMESLEQLRNFIEIVKGSGCSTFIIHARKAILKGLSPKQNREVPPLRYEWVHQIKTDFPELEIIINGGIQTLDQCQQHLEHLDGVMIGREAYQNPYELLSQVDCELYGNNHRILSRLEIAEAFIPYLEAQLQEGAPLYSVLKHLLGLFHGQRGGKQFRRHISENGHKSGAAIDVYREALQFVSQEHNNDRAPLNGPA
ncbi:tRNA dihydrouridine(20/20a) synthase DusA [Nitrincola alkalilacustris]|uniref:tRNA dihydrouridine(20/20a) synthase DusA n=1 Tax=Nitrincola alkalilacustris TaxID=1571224 RepID=UPI00124D3687|nr:tRNA dihydrouridine(20/20a) synthase DusA [Nitrincola alkalilacustris]